MKKEDKKKTIYCPTCGRKVFVWDGKSTIVKSAVCKKCEKLVVWDPESGNIRLNPIPARTQASGMRMW